MNRRLLNSWTARATAGAVLAGGIALSAWGIADAASTGAASSARSSSLSLASSGGSKPSVPKALPRHFSGHFPGFGFGFGPFGGGALGQLGGLGGLGLGGLGFGPGSAIGGPGGRVTAIGSGSITISEAGGSSQTVVTNSSTRYLEGRGTVQRSALRVGQLVVVAGKGTSSTSTSTATAIAIVGPSIAGKVVSHSGSTITVQDSQGFYRTIRLGSSTMYDELGAPVTASAVKDGTEIAGLGVVDSDHTSLDASLVEIAGPAVAGRVTKVSGTSITITSPTFTGGKPGTTTTVVSTSGSTVFRAHGTTSSLSALKTGDVLEAAGTTTSSGFDAAVVVFGSFPSPLPAVPSGKGIWPGRVPVPGLKGIPFGSFTPATGMLHRAYASSGGGSAAL